MQGWVTVVTSCFLRVFVEIPRVNALTLVRSSANFLSGYRTLLRCMIT